MLFSNISQINQLARSKPRYLQVSSTGIVSIPTEVLEGDALYYNDTTVVTGYPAPVPTETVKLNGATHSFPYTVPNGSAGQSLQYFRSTYNGVGVPALVNSAAVTISPAQGFVDMNLLGGNIESTGDYATAPLFRNAVYDSRGWGYTGLYGTHPLLGGNSGTYSGGGSITLSQISGLSYAMTITSWTVCPMAGNSADVGRVFTITLSGVVYTATVTASGTNTGTATTAPNSNTCTCTVTLSAAPTTLTNITTWSLPIGLDANGWPTQKCELVLTSWPGQLAGGVTYQMTVKSKNPALVITATTGSPGAQFWNTAHPTPQGSMNFTGTTSGGITTYTFNISWPAGSSLIFEFSDGVTFIDLPRDGSATTQDGGSPFWGPALAHYSRFYSGRFMDFFSTNGKTDTDWNTRTPYTQFPVRPFAYEWAVDFFNALYEYPGSKFRQVWGNIGGLCTVAPANARNGTTYVENLIPVLNNWNSGLYTYSGINPNLKVIWEYGNEPWNFAFNLWGTYINYAMLELQMLSTANYGGVNDMVDNLTYSAGVATVNCVGVKPSYVVNGATMLCSSDGNYWQGLDGSSNQANLTSPTTISNVTVGVDGSNNPIFSFTYPCGPTNSTNSATTLTGSASRWSVVFNLTSNLALDSLLQLPANQAGISGVNNYYATTIKWMVRQAWRVKQILKNGGVGGAKRVNDNVIINMQQYGNVGVNANGYTPPHFTYGQWLDSTANPENPAGNATPALSNWLYGAAIAPYISANTSGSWTGNSTALTNVPTFAAWAVGDSGVVSSGNTSALYPNTKFANSSVAATVTAYLQTTVTNINGNVVTVADYAVGSTAVAPGSNIVAMVASNGSTVVAGTIGVGVMLAGSNSITFTTPIANLHVGDTIAVHNAGGYPLNTTVTGLRLINTVSINATGSSYVGGTYTGVVLSGGTGTGAQATINVSGGKISSVTLTARGTGYSVNDILTFPTSSVGGGSGSGGSIKVLTLTTSLADAAYAGIGTGAIVANGFGAITAGTGYTSGTYTNVAMTNVSSSGAGAKATIVVSGGVVTSVTMTTGGTNYQYGDVLSAAATDVGGTGTGFQVVVGGVNILRAVPTTGSAVGQVSYGTMTTNNVFISGLSLTGLAVGDKITIQGAGNPSLFFNVAAVDSVNSILTMDRPVVPQLALNGLGVYAPYTTPKSTVIMTGVNPASVVKAMMINLQLTDAIVRTHVTACALFGIKPMAYEGGPDTQCIALWQNEIHTYSDPQYGMDALVNTLLDIWYQNGGKDFHFFTLGPSAFIDASLTPDRNGNVSPGSLGSVAPGVYLNQSCWQVCQSYTDLTSPKLAALIAYNTPKWYQNAMSYPVVPVSAVNPIPNARLNRYTQATDSLASYQRVDVTVGGVAVTGTSVANNVMTTAPFTGGTIVSFNAITADRTLTYLVPVPRGGKYYPVVWGTDAVAGTPVQVTINRVAVSGTQTLGKNGAGNTVSAKPVASTGATAVTLTSGMCLVQVTMPANTGSTTAGIWTIKMVLTT